MRPIPHIGRFKTLFSRGVSRHIFGRSLTTHRQRHLQPPSEPFDKTISSINSVYSHPCCSHLGRCKSHGSLRKLHALLIVHGLVNDLLCQTKLLSMYGSFGNLRYARVLFDTIENPDFYSYKVMIRWYFLNESYAAALMLYKCMRKCLRENDFIIFSFVLTACTKLGEFDEGRKLHCHIVKAGNPDSFGVSGLVHMYAKWGDMCSSRKVFDETVEPSTACWSALIVGYVQNDCPEEGFILFNRMRRGLVRPNELTIGSLLSGCASLAAIHQGKWLHGYIIKTGFPFISFLATTLLDMYVKGHRINHARSVFDELPEPDFIAWTAMIVGYAQSGQGNESLKLFVDKKYLKFSPNSVTIASVLSACASVENLNTGSAVHGLSIKLCLEEDDSAVQNALVYMYAKCQELAGARLLFDSVPDKNVITWNSMISGYAHNGDAYNALHLFHQMRCESYVPDPVTVVCVLTACASASALSIGSSLHSYLVKGGILCTTPRTGTALLNLYGKCGDTVSSRRVFDEMRGNKNAVTWSALIRGYGMHGDAEESLALFSDMLKDNVTPTEAIFTSVLSACSHTGKVGEGWRCFNSMCDEHGITPSMKHYATMVDILSRAGRLEEALDFIQKMRITPDATVYGSFLHGCSLHSRFDLGETAARRMLKLHPDEACYYVLVSKFYASNGKWEEADQVRDMMHQRGLNKSAGCSSMEMETEMEVNEESHPSRVAAHG